MDDGDVYETPREFTPDGLMIREDNIQYTLSEYEDLRQSESFVRMEPTRDKRNENFLWNQYQETGDSILTDYQSAENGSSSFSNLPDLSAFQTEYQVLQDQYKAKCVALKEIQKQKMTLTDENRRLIAQLALEKSKGAQINQKIKYIQDNQNLLLRLKEEYKTLKLNQKERKSLEDKEFQCDSGDLTPCLSQEIQTISLGCIAKESQANIADPNMVDIIPIKEADINAIQDTVKLLKQKMRYVRFDKEENLALNYKLQLDSLKKELESLKIIATNKDNDYNKLVQEVTKKSFLVDKVQKEKLVLKKIVIKLEKRRRDFVKKFKDGSCEVSNLISAGEKKIVNQIVKRYVTKNTLQSATASKTSTCSAIPSSNSILLDINSHIEFPNVTAHGDTVPDKHYKY